MPDQLRTLDARGSRRSQPQYPVVRFLRRIFRSCLRGLFTYAQRPEPPSTNDPTQANNSAQNQRKPGKESERLLSRKEVAARWGVSTETIKRRARAEEFYRPLRFNQRLLRYQDLSDIERIERDAYGSFPMNSLFTLAPSETEGADTLRRLPEEFTKYGRQFE